VIVHDIDLLGRAMPEQRAVPVAEVLPGQPKKRGPAVYLTAKGRILPAVEELPTPSVVRRLANVVLELQLGENAPDVVEVGQITPAKQML
jgi:hypothetical protein